MPWQYIDVSPPASILARDGTTAPYSPFGTCVEPAQDPPGTPRYPDLTGMTRSLVTRSVTRSLEGVARGSVGVWIGLPRPAQGRWIVNHSIGGLS
jgi:hypothetical protein